jgi:hypothetical protein
VVLRSILENGGGRDSAVSPPAFARNTRCRWRQVEQRESGSQNKVGRVGTSGKQLSILLILVQSDVISVLVPYAQSNFSRSSRNGRFVAG